MKGRLKGRLKGQQHTGEGREGGGRRGGAVLPTTATTCARLPTEIKRKVLESRDYTERGGTYPQRRQQIIKKHFSKRDTGRR